MTTEPLSPLRQRMIEEMTIRQFGAKTQNDYVRVIRDFARFLGRSPDLAEPEDLRRYQLHLASLGSSPAKMNAAVSALRFFFKVTLCQPQFGDRLTTVRSPERLPVVLSPEEVALLLHCAPSLKCKAALSVAYGGGLRASEIVHLKIGDIDSARMLIRVDQGKGRKDRSRLLPTPLPLLRRAHARHRGLRLRQGANRPHPDRQLMTAAWPASPPPPQRSARPRAAAISLARHTPDRNLAAIDGRLITSRRTLAPPPEPSSNPALVGVIPTSDPSADAKSP